MVSRYLTSLAREAEMEFARISGTEWDWRTASRAARIVLV